MGSMASSMGFLPAITTASSATQAAASNARFSTIGVVCARRRGRSAGLQLAGLAAILSLDRLVDLLAVDRNLAWRLNAQANLVTSDVDDRHNDFIANHDAFVALSG
jgi:hypothetical protein